MDKQYSVKFFSSFIEAMQKLCREYLDFDQGVELSGYLAVEIDNFKKERYVLSELVQSTGNVISESYCTKAFKTLRKEPAKISHVHGSENIAPRDHMNRSNRSHSEEVAIILRDSPETVHHSNFSIHTTPHKQSGHNQRHAFHQSPRAQTSSNRHRDTSSISVGNPFELSSPSNRGHPQQPFEIQPRCSDSLQVMSSPSSKTVTPQKRTIVDVDTPHSNPTPKRDKLDHVEPGIESLLAATENVESHADLQSMQNIYSTTATTTTSTSSSSEPLHTTLDSSSQPSGNESLRLPIGVDIKQEKDDDAAFMIIENPNDPTVKLLEAEGMFGGERETSQTLDLDTSTSFSADSQSGEHGDYKDSGNLGDVAGTSWDTSNQMSTRIGFKYRKHTANHDGEPYTCSKCHKLFTLHHNLLRHQRSVHKEGFNFSCTICGKPFFRKDHLSLHLKGKHPTSLESMGHYRLSGETSKRTATSEDVHHTSYGVDYT